MPKKTKKPKPSVWDSDGLPAENSQGMEMALDLLEFMPKELYALYEACKAEGYVWERVARHEEDQEKKEKQLAVSRFFWRRAQRWKELAEVEEAVAADDTDK